MNTTLLIAADSIRALLHKRLLVALMLATLGLSVVFSVLLTQTKELMFQIPDEVLQANENGLTEAELEQMRQQMGTVESTFLAGFYWFTALGGALVSLFICCTAVAADIRSGTIRIILAKPVSRAQFLLGKYSGAVAVMFGYSALIGVALVIFTYSNGLDPNPAARYAPWLMFCHNLMVGSVGLLLSLLMHPLIAAVIAYFASASFLSSPNPLYFILPSYDRYNVFTLIAEGRLIALEDIFLLTLYAVDVAVLVLLLALWRFRSKELL